MAYRWFYYWKQNKKLEKLKNSIVAFIYFLLSTIITWWFIKQAELLYFSQQKMLLSCTIAGAKWGLQIIAALLFLQEKKWEFIKLIAFTCFIGSCILLPYCLLEQMRSTEYGFLISLIMAVFFMMLIYYKVVKQTGISVKWFWGWMGCLTIAVALQVFVVFKIV